MTLSAPAQISPYEGCLSLTSKLAHAEIFLSSASVHHYAVRLENGHLFKPFAEAQWLDDYRDFKRTDVSRHLQILGGEFPCVPFGTTSYDPGHHGYCVENDWRVVSRSDSSAILEIEYPSQHPVRGLRRQITLDQATGALICSLEIEARCDCRMPIGVHPIFKVASDMRIVPPLFKAGASAPWNIDQNDKRKLSKTSSITPQSDIWRTIGDANNELFQVWNTDGNAQLHYPSEQSIIELKWNQQDFPHCLFWLANPGLHEAGLGESFTGLGIEPTHSFFDRNDAANGHKNLHNSQQNDFGISLIANQVWSTQYQISCHSLASNSSENSL